MYSGKINNGGNARIRFNRFRPKSTKNHKNARKSVSCDLY